MRQAFVAKNGADFGIEQLDGAGVDPKRLPELLQAAPFLANSRLVILEGLGKNKPATEVALTLLAKIPDTTVAVFADTEVDQRTSWFKILSTEAKVVKFDLLEGSQLSSWIKRTAEEQGGRIERPGVDALAAACGPDQWRLEQEIQKLVSYAPDITEETVKLLVETTVEQSIFELVEAITSGKTSKVLTMYRELIRQRVNEFYLLTMVQWQLRNLLSAKAGEGLSSSELAKRVKMSPYVAGKAQQAARRLSVEDLEAGFLTSLDAEVAMKSGRPQQASLEQLLYDLSTRFR